MGGSRTFSNAQPYLGMTFGRDLGAVASVFASVGYSASNNSCFQRSAQGDYLFTERQAQAILGIRLQRLTGLEREKLDE